MIHDTQLKTVGNSFTNSYLNLKKKFLRNASTIALTLIMTSVPLTADAYNKPRAGYGEVVSDVWLEDPLVKNSDNRNKAETSKNNATSRHAMPAKPTNNVAVKNDEKESPTLLKKVLTSAAFTGIAYLIYDYLFPSNGNNNQKDYGYDRGINSPYFKFDYGLRPIAEPQVDKKPKTTLKSIIKESKVDLDDNHKFNTEGKNNRHVKFSSDLDDDYGYKTRDDYKTMIEPRASFGGNYGYKTEDRNMNTFGDYNYNTRGDYKTVIEPRASFGGNYMYKTEDRNMNTFGGDYNYNTRGDYKTMIEPRASFGGNYRYNTEDRNMNTFGDDYNYNTGNRSRITPTSSLFGNNYSTARLGDYNYNTGNRSKITPTSSLFGNNYSTGNDNYEGSTERYSGTRRMLSPNAAKANVESIAQEQEQFFNKLIKSVEENKKSIEENIAKAADCGSSLCEIITSAKESYILDTLVSNLSNISAKVKELEESFNKICAQITRDLSKSTALFGPEQSEKLKSNKYRNEGRGVFSNIYNVLRDVVNDKMDGKSNEIAFDKNLEKGLQQFEKLATLLRSLLAIEDLIFSRVSKSRE